MVKPLLQAEHLTVATPDGAQLLQDVSFAIHAREVVGLLGPNGSGKTSLLRCLYGSQKQYQGKITLQGQLLTQMSERQRARRLAAVIQESPADFQLTVEAVIRTGRTPHQHWLTGTDPNADAIIRHYVDQFQLNDYLQRDIADLSGGERKRVMLCRALVQEPEVLLLDEPCNHLDIAHQLSLLQQLRELPMSCLISLHDFPQAARFCDRLLILKQGRLVYSGDVENGLTDARLSDLFSITANTYSNPWQSWSFYPSPLLKSTSSSSLIQEK